LFGRNNVSASVFPWSFQFIPLKAALQGKYFATFFLFKKFSGNLLCHFIAQQMTKNPLREKFFNRNTMEIFLTCLGIEPLTFL
jgi:hypothetical protein